MNSFFFFSVINITSSWSEKTKSRKMECSEPAAFGRWRGGGSGKGTTLAESQSKKAAGLRVAHKSPVS